MSLRSLRSLTLEEALSGLLCTKVLQRPFLIHSLHLMLPCLTLAPRAPQLRMSQLPVFAGCGTWQPFRICVPEASAVVQKLKCASAVSIADSVT